MSAAKPTGEAPAELRFACDNCHGADLPSLSVRAHGMGQENGRRAGLLEASDMIRDRALKIIEAMKEGPGALGVESLRYCRDVLATLGVQVAKRADELQPKTSDGDGCQACTDGVDHDSCEPYFVPSPPKATPPACEDCGGESGAPSSACPLCGKIVCQNCAEREGSFCCDEARWRP